MNNFTTSGVLHPVADQGAPKLEFVNEIAAWLPTAPDDLFAPNNEQGDVYGLMRPVLATLDADGKWTDLLDRRAAGGEILRVLSMFESGERWTEGVDTTNARSMEDPRSQETGAFQVSFDSLGLDDDGTLKACVIKYCGGLDVQTFIDTMKSNHIFAMEYAMRLLRKSVRWDGPIKKGWVASAVRRQAKAEFKAAIYDQSAA